MKHLSVGSRWNADLIASYHEQWSKDPSSVDGDWRAFFEGFELGLSLPPKPGKGAPAAGSVDATAQWKVLAAIQAYRMIGHLQARINPLAEPFPHFELTDKALGLDALPADRVFHTGDFLGGQMLPLGEILAKLKATYCGPIGVEFTHIQDGERRRWLQERVESCGLRPSYDAAARRRFLRSIVQAEQFERFLHKTFVGAKRFSVEGGEVMLAVMDQLIHRAPAAGVADLVIGMAHRGRLNVLVNVCGKKPEALFAGFSEQHIPDTTHGDGDVKYHLGYAGARVVDGKEIGVTLAFNPSHLEAVNPVVLGRARALVDLQGGAERSKVLPILLHGDAAFAGQGVVMETLNLAGLKGYQVGGTLHIVSNNQVGFTTNPDEARTGRHCTEIAKFTESPIFHANGDDPDAVVLAAEIALEYRQKFGADAVLDIVCYRRYGHNETDEPAFTQPVLYKEIAAHPSVAELYASRLTESKSAPDGELIALRTEFDVLLNAAQERAQASIAAEVEERKTKPVGVRPFRSAYEHNVDTTAPRELLDKVAPVLWQTPPDFAPNPKIKRLLDAKAEAYKAGANIDWSLGEGLAFASLLAEGYPVRISGQDCERGTFSHRHAVLHDPSNDAEYCPLGSIAGAEIELVNSSLSEYAVLGFDYGYSLEAPDSLVIWEAQFGDFANGAQIMIDQFIASAESKWGQTSGLVMLLPHGYEGQGPEHSSARLERFLQLCAENNLQVAQPSTPAQLFHALRRQVKSDLRKPLVVMTPKSLLRHKACVSTLADLTGGRFQAILPDATPAAKTERLLLCSGKVFYELDAERAARKDTATTIVRVEQFYPFDSATLAKLHADLGSPKKVVWVQDEPKNMGGWSFVAPLIEDTLGLRPAYAGRDAAASPAVGSLSVHKIEQADVIRQAFSA
ncbi:MAG: Multifunctional 2-oxoglutarate metabolism enzyme [Verrucomicrobiota bacterium]|jgi:2-oxoglutarate dehydrogenase E1 component